MAATRSKDVANGTQPANASAGSNPTSSQDEVMRDEFTSPGISSSSSDASSASDPAHARDHDGLSASHRKRNANLPLPPVASARRLTTGSLKDDDDDPSSTAAQRADPLTPATRAACARTYPDSLDMPAGLTTSGQMEFMGAHMKKHMEVVMARRRAMQQQQKRQYYDLSFERDAIIPAPDPLETETTPPAAVTGQSLRYLPLPLLTMGKAKEDREDDGDIVNDAAADADDPNDPNDIEDDYQPQSSYTPAAANTANTTTAAANQAAAATAAARQTFTAAVLAALPTTDPAHPPTLRQMRDMTPYERSVRAESHREAIRRRHRGLWGEREYARVAARTVRMEEVLMDVGVLLYEDESDEGDDVGAAVEAVRGFAGVAFDRPLPLPPGVGRARVKVEAEEEEEEEENDEDEDSDLDSAEEGSDLESADEELSDEELSDEELSDEEMGLEADEEGLEDEDDDSDEDYNVDEEDNDDDDEDDETDDGKLGDDELEKLIKDAQEDVDSDLEIDSDEDEGPLRKKARLSISPLSTVPYMSKRPLPNWVLNDDVEMKQDP
ncbi:hypothetical protein SLS55_003439 [Diplodia seriata]|uniref:Replicase polyprotein 1a n=1 Tax=Diplodia seriata TaxID=420778 RepID=A0ABR3CMY6_9PEZI